VIVARRSRDELDPLLVLIGEQADGVACVAIGPNDSERSLIA